MSDTLKLLDILSQKNSVLRNYTGNGIPSITHYSKNNINYVISSGQYKDDYEVQHGLSDQDIRIIFKIMAKDYEDAGRKRGAILRYINHYKEMEANETNINVDLLRKLNQIASKNHRT